MGFESMASTRLGYGGAADERNVGGVFRRRVGKRRRLRRLTLLAGAGFGLAALRRRKLAEHERTYGGEGGPGQKP